MKYFISRILGMLTSCSYPSFDGEWVRDVRLDNIKVSVYEHFTSTIEKWSEGAPNYYMYRNFNAEIWCVECPNGNYGA